MKQVNQKTVKNQTGLRDLQDKAIHSTYSSNDHEKTAKNWTVEPEHSAKSDRLERAVRKVNHEDSSYDHEETSEFSGNQKPWNTPYNQWWQIQLWYLSE